MKLVPIKISELNEQDKYHVFDKESHIYFVCRFNKQKRIFITESSFYPWIDELRPKEIKAIGAEFITDSEIHKMRSICNIVEE